MTPPIPEQLRFRLCPHTSYEPELLRLVDESPQLAAHSQAATCRHDLDIGMRCLGHRQARASVFDENPQGSLDLSFCPRLISVARASNLGSQNRRNGANH